VSRLFADVHVFCAQTDEDANRLSVLGAPSSRVHTVGSTKYDMAPPDAERVAMARSDVQAAGIAPNRVVLLGGSTWPGEEDILLNLYIKLKSAYPELALILTPRHAERAEEIVRLIESRGLSYARRRHTAAPSPGGLDVYLVDTTGELMVFYALADVVFVGKSLTQHGGQNVIEPAVMAKAVLVGPHMENFPGVMADFLSADAILQVKHAEELEQQLFRLLSSQEERDRFGRRAAELVSKKSGALKRTLDLVDPMLDR